MYQDSGLDESNKLLYYDARPNFVGKSIMELEVFYKTKMECPSCGKPYKIKKYYEMHLRYCGKEPNLQCEHCSFKSNHEKGLKYHVALKHPEIKAAKSNNLSMTCPRCNSVYKTEALLYNHMNYCQRPVTNQCNFCPYKTKSASSLRIHIYQQHAGKETAMESDEPKLVCPDCGKDYSTKPHRMDGHRNYCKKAYLRCALCPFKSKNKWNLSKHINIQHLKIDVLDGNTRGTLLACPKCGKNYRYPISLSKHMTTCGNKKPPMPSMHCELCSYKCCKQIYLDLHVIREHLIDDSS